MREDKLHGQMTGYHGLLCVHVQEEIIQDDSLGRSAAADKDRKGGSQAASHSLAAAMFDNRPPTLEPRLKSTCLQLHKGFLWCTQRAFKEAESCGGVEKQRSVHCLAPNVF